MRGRGRSEGLLLRRLESINNKYSYIDDIVNHLRMKYPEYKRMKLQPFTRLVQKTLDQPNRKIKKPSSSNTPSNGYGDGDDDDDDDEDIRTPPASKRRRKSDSRENRLLNIENQFLQEKFQGRTSTSSSPFSSSASTPEESTSEDAIYDEKVEPVFDLLKSKVREGYIKSAPIVKPNAEEKNLEFEVGEKVRKMIDMIEGGDTVERPEKREVKGSSSNSVEVKGKEGPMFKDLGGMDGVLKELIMEVIVPLYHPQLPQWLGVKPMSGILLHGPPGCGKTKLAHAIANETGVSFYKISATEVVSGVSGASEENIRELFSKAYRTAPSIVFIDEIDAIGSKRENLQREMERRIVTQLMTCMDELHRVVQPSESNSNSKSSDCRTAHVLVIGATNRPDAVDSALRRPGRFDREIALGVPDESARIAILTVLTRALRVDGSFDLVKIARATPGFVGADLAALANKAGNLAMKRIIDRRKSELSAEDVIEEHMEEWWKHPWLPEEMEKLSITMADFEEAARMVQPSLRREGFSTIPNVKWEDVGGLDFLRQQFDRFIVRRIKYPEDYEEFGVDLETGFLLYGPPGCGKTLIAKAVANEAGANFIHVKGPELLNKYVGESESEVRKIFSRARTCAPCILFFDEVDALTTNRGKEGEGFVGRLVNQLLVELDGADQRRGVFVIGATNRPQVMDRALLRPGRFGKFLYVPLPNANERGLILEALARKKPLNSDVDLIAIAHNEACENLSGADLSALMNEAAMVALEEKLTLPKSSSDTVPWTIKATHFQCALGKITPSVSVKQKQFYQNLSMSFTAA